MSTDLEAAMSSQTEDLPPPAPPAKPRRRRRPRPRAEKKSNNAQIEDKKHSRPPLIWPETSPGTPRSLASIRLLKQFTSGQVSLPDLLKFRNDELREQICHLVAACGEQAAAHRLKLACEYRPCDWRWQLALAWLSSHSENVPQDVVNEVDLILRVQIGICLGSRDRQLLAVLGVPTHAIDAFDCYAAEGARRGWRLAIEARLVASATIEQIAQTTNLPHEAIRFYERTFFDVSDRLEATGFIVREAVENSEYASPIDREILRLSYSGGPHVAEHLLLGFDPTVVRPATAEEVELYLKADIRRTLQAKAVLALRSLDVSDASFALRIVKVFQWRQIQERRFEQRQPVIGCMQAGIESFRSFVSTAITGETPLAAMAAAIAKSGRLPTEGYPNVTSDHSVREGPCPANL